jgi:hypothetical protein
VAAPGAAAPGSPVALRTGPRRPAALYTEGQGDRAVDTPHPTYVLLGPAARAWAEHAWGTSDLPLTITVRRDGHVARMELGLGLPLSPATETAARLALLTASCLGPQARKIILLCAAGPLQAKQIARRLGMPRATTHLREDLASLVERGVLCTGPAGYSPADLFFVEIATRFEAALSA